MDNQETVNTIIEEPVTNENETVQVFDKNRAKKNIIVSIVFKLVILALSFLAKRFLIKYCGNDFNGLNALFNSIISFLAIADLGIGNAIIFCMYEPIAKSDVNKVRQLYTLFKKIYVIIGLVVLLFGIALIPFLPFLANGYTPDSTLYISYLLSLSSVVITYFYSAKMSLINAYKNNYVSTLFTSVGVIVQYALQILLLFLTKNFIIYCICKIVGSLIQIVLFSFYNKNSDITSHSEKADEETKKNVTKNVRAMFMHKIGDVIFNTIDSLVISSIIGITILGYYSNYLLIITSMNEVLKLFIVPLTSVIGHMGVSAKKSEKLSYFRFFYCINFLLGVFFYLGYFAISTDLVTLVFGENQAIDRNVVIVLSITYFIQFMRQSSSVFKDSFGLFYKDRWLALIASLVNAGLSIALAYAIGIYGVLIATIAVNLLMYHVIEPYILFKYGFEKKATFYYLMNYFLIAFFVGEVFLLNIVEINVANTFVHLLCIGFLSVGFNLIPLGVSFFNVDFKKRVLSLFKK